MKKFWLTLFPDTFLWLKNDIGIIYNSKKFKYFTFYLSEEILKLCNTLIDLDSLYSVEISDSSVDFNVKEWVEKIINIDAGILIEQNGINKKVVSYFPFLRIQNDIDNLTWHHNNGLIGNILKNLDELIFYFNGSINGTNQYFRQTDFPFKSCLSLDFSLIESFINRCSNKLYRITFIGDPFSYKNYEQLQKWISTNDYLVHFIVLAEDINKDSHIKDWFLNDKVSLTIIINNHLSLSKQFEFCQDRFDKVTFLFPVTSSAQTNSVNSIIKLKEINNCNIVPIYNGSNRQFFEENVYIKTEEFNDVRLSRREVYINMTLNVYNFGKLTITPDGNVYSNINDMPLGTIGDTVYNLIYKEMTERKSWFRIRDMKPCCDCVFQWLCPSPGNYELALEKPNLCCIN